MIAIITDSTCDIPENLLQQYNIHVVPQVVIWGDRQYRDRLDLQPVEFYQRLVKDPVRPHSSLPALGDFLDAFQAAAAAGADEIIVLTVSSAMSGTFDLARRASEEAPIPVTVVDSKGPAMTLGWQALAAARLRDAGAGKLDILDCLNQLRQGLVQLVAMESMEYLQTGGRIGGAAKWAGALLKVKPLVAINHHTGLVEPVGLSRTHAALVDQLYAKFFEKLKSKQNLRVAVLHGNALPAAEALAERIRREYQPLELLVNITGPVLGINTGPGALALCGYPEG